MMEIHDHRLCMSIDNSLIRKDYRLSKPLQYLLMRFNILAHALTSLSLGCYRLPKTALAEASVHIEGLLPLTSQTPTTTESEIKHWTGMIMKQNLSY